MIYQFHSVQFFREWPRLRSWLSAINPVKSILSLLPRVLSNQSIIILNVQFQINNHEHWSMCDSLKTNFVLQNATLVFFFTLNGQWNLYMVWSGAWNDQIGSFVWQSRLSNHILFISITSTCEMGDRSYQVYAVRFVDELLAFSRNLVSWANVGEVGSQGLRANRESRVAE
jgi:hypothetical protein